MKTIKKEARYSLPDLIKVLSDLQLMKESHRIGESETIRHLIALRNSLLRQIEK